MGNGVGVIMATSIGPPTGGGAANAAAPTSLPLAKIRPGRVWYWVALAVFLAGVAWAVVALVVVFRQVDSFPRVPERSESVSESCAWPAKEDRADETERPTVGS